MSAPAQRGAAVIASARLPGEPILDKRGNRVSPPNQHKAGVSRLNRRKRYRLRNGAAEFLPDEMVSRCGRFPVPAEFGGIGAVLRVSASGASLGGVQFCASVWHCPCCAATTAASRRVEVRRAVERHQAAGGSVFMLTATIRHGRGDDCKFLKDAVTNAWRTCLTGAPWVRWRDRLGINLVKALEVTHGRHGWHPHLHVLVFVDRDADQAAAFGAWMYKRWAEKAKAQGLGSCDPQAWKFEKTTNAEVAGNYVAKGLGPDWELTHAHLKKANAGSRGPFEILEDAIETGSTRDIALFQNYAAAFKGARQLTWSKGLKDRYEVDQATDAEVVASPAADAIDVLMIEAGAYRLLAEADRIPAVLDAVELGGPDGLRLIVGYLREVGRDRSVEFPSPDAMFYWSEKIR